MREIEKCFDFHKPRVFIEAERALNSSSLSKSSINLIFDKHFDVESKSQI